MIRKIALLPLVVLLFQVQQVKAQQTCTSNDSDVDGDGWGWENNISCRVVVSNNSDPDCTDTDGDGWGWNGAESCLMPATDSQANNSQEIEAVTDTNACIDSDGDGWGWNGAESCLMSDTNIQGSMPVAGSCVDSDGDGWGWNGISSCRLDNQEILEFTSRNSDAFWPFCDSENTYHTISHGETWGTDTTDGFYKKFGTCVRQCADNASKLTAAPGWGYDNESAAECLFDHAPDSTSAYRVPVYDGSVVSRVEFGDQFAYHLYAGDGYWQCTQETRASNTEPFTENGETFNYVFTSAGDNWHFATANSRRILQIRNDSSQSESDYLGYAKIDHNKLVIYRHSLDRLNCTAQNPVPQIQLPANVDAFEQAPDVELDQLLNRTMNCRVLESMSRSQNTAWEWGYSSTGPKPDFVITTTPDFVTEDLRSYYRFNTETWSWRDSYTQSDGRFVNFSTTGTSGSRSSIRFKHFGEHFVAENFYTCWISNGCIDDISYSVCQ